MEPLRAPGGLHPAGGLDPKDYPGSSPVELQAEDGARAAGSLPAQGSSSLGMAPAGGPGAPRSLELSERGAGGAAGGASQPLQRTGFTQCLRHAATGKTPAACTHTSMHQLTSCHGVLLNINVMPNSHQPTERST